MADPKRRWSPLENQFLREMWPRLSVDELAVELRRSPVAVYGQLIRLGLTSEYTEYVSLREAEEMTGFNRQTVERIIEWAGVPVHVVRTPQTPGSRGVWAIDAKRLSDAVVLWLAHETVHGAAEARDIPEQVLLRWLREDGVIPPPEPGRRSAFRIPTAMIDHVVARRIY